MREKEEPKHSTTGARGSRGNRQEKKNLCNRGSFNLRSGEVFADVCGLEKELEHGTGARRESRDRRVAGDGAHRGFKPQRRRGLKAANTNGRGLKKNLFHDEGTKKKDEYRLFAENTGKDFSSRKGAKPPSEEEKT